jgi:hypothetical protein
MTCTCGNTSPFLWQGQPSSFVNDPVFRASKTGKTTSQSATDYVEKARKQGKNVGTMVGISRNREAEMLRVHRFAIFSLARSNREQTQRPE